jgi:hypothetical protein
MATNQYTFWKLINECSIEIPTIQRDYTYGRKKAKEIGSKLIGSILDSLKSDSKEIHLDFVYGKRLGIENFKEFERNKTNIDTLLQSISSYAENLNLEINYNTIQKQAQAADVVSFIPLDGQQRLTTLFLIHWYIVNLTKSNSHKLILNRFNYATRVSSREFLRMICNSHNHFTENNELSISETIENHEAFFTFWKKDPTVASMLSVLDEIQKQFREKELNPEDCWEKLTSHSKTTFDFFDLDDFKLTDELYLKMNARGMKLSDFENFKAWLIKVYSDKVYVNEWKKNLDIRWNDIFWNKKEDNQTKIDDEYLQFFKNMYLGDYLYVKSTEKTLNETNIKSNESDISSINEKDEIIDLLRLGSSYNPIGIFEANPLFEEKINDYLKLLEYFAKTDTSCVINPHFIKCDLLKFIFNKNKSLNWWDTTFYFAITRYIIAVEGDFTHLNNWIRVISNLIYNTPIESPKLYLEACESINDLIQKVKGNDIYSIIKNLSVDEISFFNEKQKEEEIKKAQLIIDDPNNKWEELFISLEQETYFYGQIGFIFNINDNISFVDFEKTSKKISVMFTEKLLNNNTYLFFRSLLTIGNCFFENGDTLTYPSNVRGTLRNRNENWRKFFNSKTTFLMN